MRVELNICAECAESGAFADAEMRLRFALARFAASVVRAALRSVACGPGRVRMRGDVRLVGGADVSLTAEDEASEAAVMYFIDRIGRAVARRWAQHGGRHG